MKIAYITAGAAGMYCGSCLHDNTLAGALMRKGHEVSLIPTYTPIRTDEHDVSVDQVFYGAVNVYLEQRSALFRHTPRAIDRLVNGKTLLNWVSGRGMSSTDARLLGDITLSVLRGEEGRQAKELERLVGWLRDSIRPDVVHLTNSMFLGMARRIKQELGIPVVCSVQGEDLFIEDLIEPQHSQVKETLRERAADIDAFVATSDYYVDFMRDYLQLTDDRMKQVRLGLNLADHGQGAPASDGRPFVIAYLARRAPEKGLHLLAEAFRELARREGAENVRLRVAGYLSPKDEAYYEEIVTRLREWGLAGSVDLIGEVDRAAKMELLQSAHVVSVPTVYREPKGLFVLEALANGVPVVQPRHGAFPELIEATGGGETFEPGSVPELVERLSGLMHDPGRRAELGSRGKEAVYRDFNDDVMAEATLEVYRSCLGAEARGGTATAP